jgi:GST-like protein
MFELHFWPTPNGHKITIALEEMDLAYRLLPLDIGAGAQFAPEFLAISPNNRMPALVDTAPADGGAPISVFESGAILIYLAEKTGRFLPPPADPRGRKTVLEWLRWQMGGLGPMAGQNGHFLFYAPEDVPYAKRRYGDEVNRLLGVMERRLARVPYLAGDYSIADMACYPWVAIARRQGQTLQEFPALTRWYEAIKARPAVQRAYVRGKTVQAPKPGDVTAAAKKILFGQTAKTVAERDG